MNFKRLQIGMSQDDVRGLMGEPSQITPARDGVAIWWYVRGPQGFVTYRIAFDRSSRMAAAAQVLTEANFRRLEPGRSTRADVLDLLGPPRGNARYPNLGETVLTWRYQDGTFNKFLHVHFDASEVVTRYDMQFEDTSG